MRAFDDVVPSRRSVEPRKGESRMHRTIVMGTHGTGGTRTGSSNGAAVLATTNRVESENNLRIQTKYRNLTVIRNKGKLLWRRQEMYKIRNWCNILGED